MSVRVEHGDCRNVLRTLVDASVSAVVTDPPYSLQTINKRLAKAGRDDKTWTRSGPPQRTASGFMNQKWDTGETAFDPEFWAQVLRMLKPGGHVVAFGGTRTSHRLTCAIEDAGFEIRDQIGWCFGSGFPKSHNVGKAIDKMAGAQRQVIAQGAPIKRIIPGADQNRDGWIKDNGRVFVPTETAPATDAAAAWEGWGTALKPAWEPICLARKPLDGTVAENVLRHGTGALNIDGCRVETDASLGRNNHARTDGTSYVIQREDRYIDNTKGLGRWPANLCHDGSEEVVAAFPVTESGLPGNIKPTPSTKHAYGEFAERSLVGHIDSGSAARFFFSAKADADDRVESKHPTVKPVALMRWLVRLITPPGGLVLDPFAGTGTTGAACIREGFDCILIEREDQYVADIRRRIARMQGLDNPLFASAAQ